MRKNIEKLALLLGVALVTVACEQQSIPAGKEKSQQEMNKEQEMKDAAMPAPTPVAPTTPTTPAMPAKK